MNENRTTNGSFIRRIGAMFAAIALWFYTAIAAFVWYGAHLVPEQVVGIRIVAGAVSDQVWLPIGVLIWCLAIDWVWHIRANTNAPSRLLRFVVHIVIACSVLVFPAFAFHVLCIPITILVLRAVVRLRLFREGVPVLIRAIPFWSLIVLTCLYYNWLLVPFHPVPLPDRSASSEVKVITYNIYRRVHMDRRQQIIETLRNADADVVCMVEVLFDHDEPLFAEKLGDLYPYMVTSKTMSGVRTNSMILSKYPVEAFRPAFENWSSGPLDFAFYTLNVDNRDITLVNFHLQTVGHYFERLPQRTGAIQERLAHSNEQEGHIDRTKYAQVTRICEYLNETGGPVIICGDMNDTANGRVYRLFRKSFDDVYASVGWGMGTTFGRTWLLNKKRVREFPLSTFVARDFLRIDYVLVGGGILPRSASVIKSANGSDHRPLIATIHIP